MFFYAIDNLKDVSQLCLMPADTHIAQMQKLYQDHIDSLTDAFTRAKAQIALDAWKLSEEQYQGILEAQATQYTTTGRTVTKRSVEQARNARDYALADLEGILGVGDASVTYVNNGGRIGATRFK